MRDLPQRRPPIDLTALTTRLNTYAGFDLSEAEACDLLNDGMREAARRSRYPRKTVELGPTVAGQTAYDLPEDFLLPVSVSVAGYSWGSANAATIRQYVKGDLILQDRGVFSEVTDDQGNRQLGLYPVQDSGSTLTLEYVFTPPALSTTEASRGPDAFPEYWHPKLRYFAAEVYYETIEDDPELAELNKAKGDAAAGDLLRYDNERQGGGEPFRMPLSGFSA